jgi:hypothetical protein
LKKIEVSEMIKKIVGYSCKSSANANSLGELFKDDISYKEATSCHELFFLFLEHSKNNLLQRMIKSRKMGRCARRSAYETFLSIW